jgi:phosphate transport system substrate-binding protein
MNRVFCLTRFLLPVLAAGALMSCDKAHEAADTAPAGQLIVKGAGATFPQPLYERWIDEYSKSSPGTKFEYEGVGSGEGIKRFIAGEVDFGASDAAMKDSEIAQVERGVALLPMTAGMVVLGYNLPGFDGELKLPRDVYVDIMLGNIYRWDDPRIAAANPGVTMPPRLIQVVARRDSSGTTFAFTNHLGTVSEAWRDGPGIGKLIDWPGGAMTGNGNAGVAQKIKITNNSIGYLEYGFAKRLGLPIATLQNKSGAFVSPNATSGQLALAAGSHGAGDDLRIYVPDPPGEKSYPIVTYTWLLVYRNYADADTARAVKEAVAWGLDSGQPLAEEMGYIPLPDAIRRRALELASKVN